MGADTLVVKKKHEWNPMAGDEEQMVKHRDMEREGEKVMDTYKGGSPGHQTASPTSLETHLVRKWGNIEAPTGSGPRER